MRTTINAILIFSFFLFTGFSCKTKKTPLGNNIKAEKADPEREKTMKVGSTRHPVAIMYTNHGNIKVKLHDETPKHKKNFIKLANKKFYDGTLFHRVIKDFMIQGGDPDSKNAKPGDLLGNGGPGYMLEAEFVDSLFHKKGALAAARLGDAENPEKKSSGSQFYIVHGKVFSNGKLDLLAKRMKKSYSAKQIETYATIGGAPHLDGDYTVFGQVIDGMEVVEAIAHVKTGSMNRPVEDVIVDSVRIVK